MTRPKIIVTRRWPEAVERKLAEAYDPHLNTPDTPLSEDAIRAAMGEHDAILPTVTDRLPASVFAGGAVRVKILANYGMGFSHIDTDAAKAAGIVVTNTPDVLSDCTADIAMTLLLSVARRAGEGERELRDGNGAIPCLPATNFRFQLKRIVDENTAMRARRLVEAMQGAAGVEGRFLQAMAKMDPESSQAEFSALTAKLSVGPTITAHPTEA